MQSVLSDRVNGNGTALDRGFSTFEALRDAELWFTRGVAEERAVRALFTSGNEKSNFHL